MLPVVNVTLIIGFFAVVAAVIFMMGWSRYNDQASHNIFILHAVNGFLLLVRATIKAK
jgi:hypothetical protein